MGAYWHVTEVGLLQLCHIGMSTLGGRDEQAFPPT